MIKNNIDLKNSVAKAAKWSAVTEVMSKIISPITNMILARILSPEIFGVIATVTMVVSFADMFTNSGFQKYLIQNEFKSIDERNKSISVAFSSNLFVSIILWAIIILFSKEVSSLVGNPGLSLVIIVASVQIPLTSFSSIQTALYRREFAFKELFIIRMIISMIPIIVTIPLALFGFGYWSLIIGSILGSFANAIIMTINSDWKPNLYFNLNILKNMLKYTLWATIDSLALWLTTWIDVFIIGRLISNYYLGLYKTSITLVNLLFGIITSAISPILFSVLSRLQKEDDAFKAIFIDIQRITAFLVLPMGLGIFLYKDMFTEIMLGKQWSEATSIIGIWGLVSAPMIVLSNFNSDVFKAKGRPEISVIIQITHMIFVVLACLISANYGFWPLIYTRALIRFTDPIISYYMINKIVNISFLEVLNNILRPTLCTLIMGVLALLLKIYFRSMITNILSIILCIITYMVSFYYISNKDFNKMIKLIKNSL